MVKLIKMDLRRLFRTGNVLVPLAVVAAINFLFTVAVIVLTKIFSPDEQQVEYFSKIISNPFVFYMLSMVMFITASSFSYGDMANGYIKNLVGQISRKSYILHKIVVLGFHNAIWILACALTQLAGSVVGSALGYETLSNDGHIGEALLTLLLKWLLSMAITCILLFITNGIGNQTLATVVSVLFGSGAMSLAYMGISMGINNLFNTKDFSLSDYMPDSLFSSVNVINNEFVVNSICVSLVCIVAFTVLTVYMFSRRDVK